MIDFTQLGLNTFQKQINPRDIFMGLTNKTEKYQNASGEFGAKMLTKVISTHCGALKE